MSQFTSTKRAKLDKSSKVIGTHNGTFHCDEALAVFLLRQTEQYRDSDVKRTRDPAILDTCDIVVDVGAIYDPANERYDHHQRGFNEVFGHGFNTKLSSAGLIYKHFGRRILADRLGISEDDPKIDTLYLKVYKEFVEAIDGIDNGVTQYPKDAQPLYRNRTDLSSRVGWLNPAWNQPADSATVDAKFAEASLLTGSEFTNRLDHYANSWLPGRDIVKEALTNRKQVEPSGRIALFSRFAPWKEHLFDIEREENFSTDELPFYIIYPDETANTWRVQAVPISPDSFESRKALPEAWRGIRDEELSQKSGIPDCIFVHASGFIGGNKTREGALAMTTATLAI